MRDRSTTPGGDGAEDVEPAFPADHLLATCWSSAGDAASDRDDLRSPLPLRERIEAASAAGFRGFGLLSADLPAAEEEYGLSGIRAMLDDNGIVDLELEGIRTGETTGRGGRSPTGSATRSSPPPRRSVRGTSR